ncbi:hypothetical protein Tco_0045747 [Tanacetum coccineum]
MQKNLLVLIKPKWNATTATKQGILQESSVVQRNDNRMEEMDESWNKDGGGTGKKEESTKALVTVDGECVDWTTHSEDDENYAFMASNSSGSDTQVTSCSNECKESYANIKRLYDTQREQLSDASVEIKAYTQGLREVEAQLVAPQQDDSPIHIWSRKETPSSLLNLFNQVNLNPKQLNLIPVDLLNIRQNLVELVLKPVINELNIEVQPKVWSDAPIIEEYESDSDDEYVTVQTKGLNTPSFANKQVKTPRKNVKKQSTHNQKPKDNPHRTLKNKGIIDSGCSRHMTGNKAYLADFQDFNGGPVAFGGSKGYITGKGKIKTGKLDFEDVSFVKELQPFNLFSVSQMCDKKNKVLFTDSECLVLSPDFKLPDENQILLSNSSRQKQYDSLI